jgi:DNA-binding IclR family transcriptional regulator
MRLPGAATILRALADEKLVAFDPDTKRYALDTGVLRLARSWLRNDQFQEVARWCSIVSPASSGRPQWPASCLG